MKPNKFKCTQEELETALEGSEFSRMSRDELMNFWERSRDFEGMTVKEFYFGADKFLRTIFPKITRNAPTYSRHCSVQGNETFLNIDAWPTEYAWYFEYTSTSVLPLDIQQKLGKTGSRLFLDPDQPATIGCNLNDQYYNLQGYMTVYGRQEKAMAQEPLYYTLDLIVNPIELAILNNRLVAQNGKHFNISLLRSVSKELQIIQPGGRWNDYTGSSEINPLNVLKKCVGDLLGKISYEERKVVTGQKYAK